jgi:hypothetical protein
MRGSHIIKFRALFFFLQDKHPFLGLLRWIGKPITFGVESGHPNVVVFRSRFPIQDDYCLPLALGLQRHVLPVGTHPFAVFNDFHGRIDFEEQLFFDGSPCGRGGRLCLRGCAINQVSA